MGTDNEGFYLTVIEIIAMSKKELKKTNFHFFRNITSEQMDTLKYELNDKIPKMKVIEGKWAEVLADGIDELNVGKPYELDGVKYEYISMNSLRAKIEIAVQQEGDTDFKLGVNLWGLVLEKLQIGGRVKKSSGFFIDEVKMGEKYLATNASTGNIAFNYINFDDFKKAYLTDIVKATKWASTYTTKLKELKLKREKEDRVLAREFQQHDFDKDEGNENG